MNSKEIYNLIMEQPVPDQWSTPETLKKSYERTKNSANFYKNAIDAQLKKLGNYKPVTATDEYKTLFDLYNSQYERGGELAAAETLAAANAMDAGYGNSYAKPAGEQAYSSYMANRGAAIPSLMAAASDAYQANKNAIAAGVQAMGNQRQLRMGALQDLFNSQFKGIQKEVASKQQAFSTQLGALSTLLGWQKQKEEEERAKAEAAAAAARAARAARAAAAAARGSNSKSKNNNNNKQKSAPSVHALTDLYSEAAKINPGIMTAGEFARRKRTSPTYSKYENYAAYVKAMVG